MEFINSKPEFKLYKENNCESEFYYCGVFDRDIKSIFRTLDDGKIPYNLRGNFAYFFKNKKRVVFAVDHACTYNMHWSKDKVSHIFYSLRSSDEKPNPLIVRQRQIFIGTTVGKSTIVKGLQRLEPGTYFEKDLTTGEEKIGYYIDLFKHKIDPTITLNDVSELFEKVIEEQTREPFGLLWSSGTDSNCVYGFIRKLKRTENCTLLSLDNDLPNRESIQIQQLAETYGVKTNYYNLGSHQGITDETKERIKDPDYDPEFKENFYRIWRGAMWEVTIWDKYKAMYDLGIKDLPMLTGEPGDLIFGSSHTKNIITTMIQRPNTSVRQLAKLFVYGDFTLQRKRGWGLSEPFANFLKSSPTNMKSWNMAIDWVVDHFPDPKNSEDFINDLDAMYYQFKGPKLLYGYTQFSSAEFRHPFLDYRIYSTMLSIPGSWKMGDGKIRQLSKELISDYVDPRPWKWAKCGIDLVFLPRSRDPEDPL